MLTNATLDGLHTLCLPGMVGASWSSASTPTTRRWRRGAPRLLVDRERTERRNRKLERALKAAKLRFPATVESIALDRLPPQRRHRRPQRARQDVPGVRAGQRSHQKGPQRALPTSTTAARRSRPRRVDGLVIDDFLIRPLGPDQAADVLVVIEDRVQLRATIVTCLCNRRGPRARGCCRWPERIIDDHDNDGFAGVSGE
jgi:hypothetical protein